MAVVLTIVFVLGMVMMLGSSEVNGFEFSPSHFQLRRFQFRRLPLLNLQISGRTYTNETSATSLFLVAKGLVKSPSKPPDRWDLVDINRAGKRSSQADASMLTTYLAGDGGSGVDWEEWSQKNMPAAKVLWPLVQNLATQQLYLLLPRVFELAENQSDPKQLDQELTGYITGELPSFADDLAAAGRLNQAIAALQWANATYPQEPSIAQALAKLSQQSTSDSSNP